MTPPSQPEGAPEPGSPVVWRAPAEFGEPAAADAKTGVAAPVLAGFSIALLAVVSQSSPAFRWPGPSILALVLATGAFVLCVQLGFRSRALLYSRADAMAWGPVNHLPPQHDEAIRAQIQREHFAAWFRGQRRVQLSYNTAIVLLALAVSMVAAPPAADGAGAYPSAAEQIWRWLAFGVGLALTALEILWTVHGEIRRTRRRRRDRRISATIKLGGRAADAYQK